MIHVPASGSFAARLAVATAVAAVLGWCGAVRAPIAAAHGGPIEFEVVAPDVEVPPTVGSPAPMEVAISYVEDGDPIDDGTVSAVAVGPSGERLDPLPMATTGTPGHFAATMVFTAAGPWTVRFSSVEPDGSFEVVVTVAAPAANQVAPTVAASTTTMPTRALIPTRDRPSGGDSTAGSTWTIAAAATALVGVAIYSIARRRRNAGRP